MYSRLATEINFTESSAYILHVGHVYFTIILYNLSSVSWTRRELFRLFLFDILFILFIISRIYPEAFHITWSIWGSFTIGRDARLIVLSSLYHERGRR